MCAWEPRLAYCELTKQTLVGGCMDVTGGMVQLLFSSLESDELQRDNHTKTTNREMQTN